MLIIFFIAYDLKYNRNVALKTENVKSPFPLTIYEANVATLLNGFGQFKYKIIIHIIILKNMILFLKEK